MRTLTFSVILATTMLASCGGTINRGLDSVHQPVVARTNYVYDASVSDGRIAPGDSQGLRDWLASIHLGYGDHIAIDDPAGIAGDEAYREVAGIASQSGLAVAQTAPVTEGVVAPGAVRIVVTRMTASVPGCPDWSRRSQPDYENNTTSNFGCALNANLAAMVANPEDLIHGQTGSATVDAATSSKAIKSYRTKPASGDGALKNESTGGK